MSVRSTLSTDRTRSTSPLLKDYASFCTVSYLSTFHPICNISHDVNGGRWKLPTRCTVSDPIDFGLTRRKDFGD